MDTMGRKGDVHKAAAFLLAKIAGGYFCVVKGCPHKWVVATNRDAHTVTTLLGLKVAIAAAVRVRHNGAIHLYQSSFSAKKNNLQCFLLFPTIKGIVTSG